MEINPMIIYWKSFSIIVDNRCWRTYACFN